MTDEERMRIISDALRDAGTSTAAAMTAFAQFIREFDRGWADALRAMSEQGRRGAVAGEILKADILIKEQ